MAQLSIQHELTQSETEPALVGHTEPLANDGLGGARAATKLALLHPASAPRSEKSEAFLSAATEGDDRRAHTFKIMACHQHRKALLHSARTRKR